jgi:hypothetical protein
MSSEFAFYDASKVDRIGSLSPSFDIPAVEQQPIDALPVVSPDALLPYKPQFASKSDLKTAAFAERIFTTRAFHQTPDSVLISKKWALIVSSDFKHLFKVYAHAENKTAANKMKLQQETQKEVERHMQEGFQNFLSRIKQKK